MAHLKLENMVDGYVDVLDQIVEEGHRASSLTWRGRDERRAETLELLAITLEVPADAPMLPVGTGRKVSTKLAAVEAIQVCGGFSDPTMLQAVTPHLDAFLDEGAFHGAYGPRIRPQMPVVLRRLRRDPGTRRAIITLWDPLRDAIEGVHNYPCATELQFMARGGKLDLHVTMRANDAWHGLAYDAFVFSQLQWTVAREVGLEAGTYYHHAASLHLYEEHVDLANGLHYGETEDTGPQPRGFRSMEFARGVAYGALSHGWYAERLPKASGCCDEPTPRPRGEKEMHP